MLCTADCHALPVCLIADSLQESVVVPLLLLNLAAFSFSLIDQYAALISCQKQIVIVAV